MAKIWVSMQLSYERGGTQMSDAVVEIQHSDICSIQQLEDVRAALHAKANEQFVRLHGPVRTVVILNWKALLF